MIVSIRSRIQPRRESNERHLVARPGHVHKCIVVVDEDVDVQDLADVTLKVLNHIDPGAIFNSLSAR
jgi:UbiD family decarboxylase